MAIAKGRLARAWRPRATTRESDTTLGTGSSWDLEKGRGSFWPQVPCEKFKGQEMFNKKKDFKQKRPAMFHGVVLGVMLTQELRGRPQESIHGSGEQVILIPSEFQPTSLLRGWGPLQKWAGSPTKPREWG